jgi:hypothetical protein
MQPTSRSTAALAALAGMTAAALAADETRAVQIGLAAMQSPITESFEGHVGVDFPGGLFGQNYGAPPAGFVFDSGLVFVSPDPNDAVGGTQLIVGDYAGTPPPTYGLDDNGAVDDPADIASGTAFAGTGTQTVGPIVFEFPLAVRRFGLFASVDVDDPLTLTAFDADGLVIETAALDTPPIPLADASFVGFESADRAIVRFSVDGPFYVFDDVMFDEGLGCLPRPRTDCRRSVEPEASKLSIQGAKAKLAWSWKKGEAVLAALPDLTTGSGASLCLYESAKGTPFLSRSAPVQGGPGWKAVGGGFRYKDKTGSAFGVTSIVLKPGEAGKSKLQVKGKGMLPPAPPLQQEGPVRIQLALVGGGCFETVLPAPARKNDPKAFKDEGD